MRGQGIALPDTHHVTPRPTCAATRRARDRPSRRACGAVGAAVSPRLDRVCQRLDAAARVRRRRAADRGFVLSDHADWAGLNRAIAATGAETVHVTHGYTEIFARWLSRAGLRRRVLRTEFTGETLDDGAEA